MNTELHRDDLIDLGSASTETKGKSSGVDDTRQGLIPFAGLSDD